MTSDPDSARRIARLENDRDATYELIDDFRDETRARFDQIDTRLSAHDARFDGIEGTLAEVLRRLPEAL